jgi:MoaA/NifB/PqqE/SkfB family radical SAM enzyme
MLIDRNIKVLHIEPTDVCQAACPLCARETNLQFNKMLQHHLDMPSILRVLSIEQISNLEKMFMCGNYGDPAAGRHTFDIFCQFRNINKDIVLGMNTNGALRNTQWWKQLGELFNGVKDYVVFSIDGLEDTNHMYRVNVNWNQLIKNAQAYIATGASAHWDMLVYQHNEHQIESCKKLAKDLGFKWFRAKVSKRPFIQGLGRPVMFKPAVPLSTGSINCHALNEQSIYIDSRGEVYPCCWLGNDLTHVVSDIKEVAVTWTSKNPNSTCQQTCAVSTNQTTFSAQWRIEEQLC